MHRLPRAIRLRQQHFIPPRTFNRLAQRRNNTQNAFKSHDGEPMRTQAVRFRSPGFTWRRAVTIGLYVGCTYGYLKFMLGWMGEELDLLEEVVEEEEEEGHDEDEEDESEYALEDSLFIPMTWAKKQPKTFYRGSDPEWQEFIKVSKDKARHQRIQDELVQIVYTASQRHPGINMRLGKDAKIGKYWLDVQFPDGPPQEYERSGIEIGDGFIAWSQQRISPENQWRLSRALWPTAAFNSFYVTGKMLAGIQYRRVKQALGWEEKDPFSPEERYKHALEIMEKQQQARERKQVGKAQLEPDGNSGAVVGSSAAASSQPSPTATSDEKKLPYNFPQIPMPSMPMGTDSTDVPIALHVFRHALKKNWNPKKMEPPKGTFVVSGLVEVRGSVGRMLFDVQSCYDPKEAKYVVINAGVRSYKKVHQAPRGGP